MFSCLAGPTILVRLMVELAVAALGFTRVLQVDRRAGLLIGTGGALAAAFSIGVPLLEAVGLYGLVSTNSGSTGDLGMWIMLGTLLAGWGAPLGQALDLALVMGGVWRLLQRIPKEQWEANTRPAAWGDR